MTSHQQVAKQLQFLQITAATDDDNGLVTIITATSIVKNKI